MTDVVRIEEVPIPSTLDDPGAADFVAGVNVTLVSRSEPFGDHLIFRPGEDLFRHHDPDRVMRMFVGRVDDEIVGRGNLEVLPTDTTTAWVWVEVLPTYRRRGVGSALLAELEAEVLRLGRSKIICDIRSEDAEGPQIPSPTGYGSAPAETAQTRYLLKRGYTFEQADRVSRVLLPVTSAAAEFEEAQAFAGPDYALHYWVGPTPERWLSDFGSLTSRIATDVPYGDLAPPEDVWDAERVARDDARRLAEDPFRRVVTAVEHVSSGELVGYSELLVPPEEGRDAIQWFTVVATHHRGHRLGMLLKAANMLHLERVFPERPGIVTGNAEENRPMLDINEKLGFVRIGQHSQWKRQL
jgi:GNAT superfamily N-acetyltransferase